MSTVKLYFTVISTTDVLWYIEEDVLAVWTVGFFFHYLSVLSAREAKYHIVPFLSECNPDSDRKAVLPSFIDKN